MKSPEANWSNLLYLIYFLSFYVGCSTWGISQDRGNVPWGKEGQPKVVRQKLGECDRGKKIYIYMSQAQLWALYLLTSHYAQWIGLQG